MLSNIKNNNNNIWKYLDDRLLKIRVKKQEGIGKSIFYYQKGQKIIILHSFIKRISKNAKERIPNCFTKKKGLRK